MAAPRQLCVCIDEPKIAGGVKIDVFTAGRKYEFRFVTAACRYLVYYTGQHRDASVQMTRSEFRQYFRPAN